MTPKRHSKRNKPPHTKSIVEFCALFGQEVPTHAVHIGPRWFHDPHGLIAAAKSREWDPFSGGAFLGEERGTFQPTSALIDLLAQTDTTTPRVSLDEKSAWLFLCGRDVLMEGVRHAPDDITRGAFVYVTDADGAVLGYAQVAALYDPKKKSAAFLTHLLDRGEYLRRER